MNKRIELRTMWRKYKKAKTKEKLQAMQDFWWENWGKNVLEKNKEFYFKRD